MRNLPRFILPLCLLAAVAANAAAQGLPTSQPGRLTVIVEELKPGMAADHEANEAGWPKAFAAANSTDYYLAVESMTGSPEIWYLLPYASWTAEAAANKAVEANPTLSAELGRLSKADGPFLAGSRTFQLVARPDLSYGAFPDVAMARFYDVTTFRVRLGHEQGFEAAAKAYRAIVEKNIPGASYRMYQVVTGMPGGTYLAFGSVTDYAEFDQRMAAEMEMWGKVSPADMATLQQSMANDIQMVITQRYRVSPTMSYIGAADRAKDPAFWK
jgi:hypothetical protein